MTTGDTTVSVDLEAGTRFGDYRIIQRLGQGGFGEVHEAEWERLHKRVALKLLKPEHAANQEFVARFKREAFVLARIDHPNVVRVLDLGELAGHHYLALELLRGETLEARFKREVRMSAEALAEIFVPILSGLRCLHRLGAVHRDLKPENVYLAEQYNGRAAPKLLDLGMVRSVLEPGERALTQEGTALGTPAYMAPEQIMNPDHVGPQTDLWSVGMMLYVGATASHPLARDNFFATAMAVCNGDLPPPSSLRPELTGPFDQLVMGLLTRDPSARIQSADAAGRALLSLASPATVAAWGDEFGFVATPRTPVSAPALRAAPAHVAAAVAPNGAVTSPIAARWARRVALPAALVASIVIAAVFVASRNRDRDTPARPSSTERESPARALASREAASSPERRQAVHPESPPAVITEPLALRPSPASADTPDVAAVAPRTFVLHVTPRGFAARAPVSMTFAYVHVDAGAPSIEACTGPCDRVVLASASVRITARAGGAAASTVVRDVRGDTRVFLDAPRAPSPTAAHPPPCGGFNSETGLMVPCL